ncbi:polyprenyl synthetase family protein [Dermacoccaceae bacterium W4C1]
MSAALGLPQISDELAATLTEGLARVDDRLRAVVEHDDAYIASVSRHLIDAGGKRFRPTLALLASQVHRTGAIDPRVIDAAAGVELTHLASLYHDDVMDEADLRRGVTSVNSAYGNTTAILVGDLLFGRASQIIAGLGSEAVLVQADTFIRLCQGQIQDDRQAPDGADRREHYLKVLADKTGVLIATAARYGGMFGGATAEQIELLAEYGELLGLIFQLSDDILDIAATSGESGKTPGTDLREGVATLPTLFVLESTDAASARLRDLVSRPLTDDAEHAEALELLRVHPGLEAAREYTRGLAKRASDLVAGLPAGDVRDALQALPAAVAERTA